MMRNWGILVVVLAAGCEAPSGDEDFQEYYDDGKADSARSWKMPKSILDYEAQNGWGDHHVQWHVERRWDLLSSSDLTWAKGQKFARARKQEGAKGNGLEFLAMHRVMMDMLIGKFPKYKKLFDGWETPPVNPRDRSNPLPHSGTTQFDDDMLDAISTLETKLESFKTDDELGLFLETAMRPTTANHSARSSDKSTGIHNYLHNRFADSSNPVDIGDPSVNLGNQLFWRLHGWIDARWTAFREAKGFSNDDPAYQAALQDAMMHMMHCCPTKGGLGGPAPTEIPDSIRHMTW